MALLFKKKRNNIAEGITAPPYSAKSKRKKSRKRLIAIISVVLVIAIGVSYFFLSSRKFQPVLAGQYRISKAEYRNLKDSLTGTGTLEPADSYVVKTLTSGDILKGDFEEGDVVEKDTLLYEIDSSNIATNIETAEIGLKESKNSYERKLEKLEDLSIKADDSGTVISLNVDVGDTVQSGQTIAVIRNSSVMSIAIPFGLEDAKAFSIGQPASVILDGSFQVLTGTVSKISSVDEIVAGGMLARQVTIDVTNPGGIQKGQMATASVGAIDSIGNGTFTYKSESNAIAKVSGEVQKVNISEGDFVKKNQVVATLESTSLNDEIVNAKNSLRKAELSLENQYKSLNNYTIKSPISGTVIEKYYKKGDKAESGSTLCTIFDLSYLKMTLNIDELDISKVSVGQKVNITSDSIERKVYEGIVTKVNINGTTSNGTTTYPITIEIAETDGLLPGMNVDAEIVIKSYEHVLTVPSEAVMRGNRVLVPSDAVDPNSDAPEGYKYVEVTIGVSDNNYVEVVSGLSEGDEVAIQNRLSNNNMGMMMGGPMGGGPMGGFQGGMNGQMGGQRGNQMGGQRGGQSGGQSGGQRGGQSGGQPGGPAGGGF